jgi:hypothetical protein
MVSMRPSDPTTTARGSSTVKSKVDTGLQQTRNHVSAKTDNTVGLARQYSAGRTSALTSLGRDGGTNIMLPQIRHIGNTSKPARPPVKPPTRTKPVHMAVQRDTFISQARRHQKPIFSQAFIGLPRSVIFRVFEFVYHTPKDYFTLTLLCKDWYNILANSLQTWQRMKIVSSKSNKFLRELDLAVYTDGKALRSVVQKACVSTQLNQINVFMKKVSEMYVYNSMKMNIPNKIIEWLQLTLDVRIGKNIVVTGHKFTCNKLNYAGFIYAEITKISKLRFASFDNLRLNLVFRSAKLSDPVEVIYDIPKSAILDICKKTRLFNYYISKNIAIIYFDNDDSILKCLFEISAVHLIVRFAELFGKTKSNIAKGIGEKEARKFETQNERLQRQIWYDSLEDYVKEQTHFEVAISIHNGKERIFYFVNTTSRPFICDDLWRNHSPNHAARGRGSHSQSQKKQNIRFKFDKLGEPLECSDVYLKLNNELGISEKIEDLIFCEIIIKDYEKIRFIDSGLRVFQRNAAAEDLNYTYDSRMVLSAEDPGQYYYRFEICQDEYSTLLQSVDISLADSYFLN